MYCCTRSLLSKQLLTCGNSGSRVSISVQLYGVRDTWHSYLARCPWYTSMPWYQVLCSSLIVVRGWLVSSITSMRFSLYAAVQHRYTGIYEFMVPGMSVRTSASPYLQVIPGTTDMVCQVRKTLYDTAFWGKIGKARARMESPDGRLTSCGEFRILASITYC